MNAPATKNALARMLDATYELIPLTNITPSETHIQKLRRARYNMESLADLRASISKLGVQQPIVVRKLAALRGLAAYELVAGERRFRAAGQADLAHIPAVIRVLTDEEVLEIQLVENLQREDLHPLEEAAGYEELMEVAKLKPEDIGERVGKSRSWVYSRLNLLKLPKEAQDALQAGQIDVSRALLVASVAEPTRRAEVLKKALERNSSNNAEYSVRQLRTEILKERLTFPLVGAPFPREDASLVPAAGACGGCQYRTGNCDPEAADPDVCTNVPCYEKKMHAQADRRRKDVMAKGGKVLKGEAARAISPSIKTVYGHVDLDLVCEHDEFPEKEPALPKDIDRFSDEADQVPAMIAWREREEAWQPRTYRALLAEQIYDSVLIDDPKTKQLRELVPFKQAQQLLKKIGIDLPSYANRKRHEFQRSGASSPVAVKKDPAKEAAEQAKRDLEERVEKVSLIRTLEQVKAKHPGVLSVDDLTFLANHALDDVPEEFWKVFGLKDPGWQTESTIKKVPGKDLPRFIAVALAAHGLTGNYRHTEATAEATLGRLKIDRKKIEADVRKELTPAPAAKTTTKGKK